jgi:hypothetical protein
MAYKCGYEGGYDDLCFVVPIVCGAGYAGGIYSGMLYGGGVPCDNVVPHPPSHAVTSNVEDFCILDPSCL